MMSRIAIFAAMAAVASSISLRRNAARSVLATKGDYFTALEEQLLHEHPKKASNLAKNSMKLAFGLFVEDSCGGLEPQFESRELKWQLACLNNRTSDGLEVFGLMTDKEKAYFDQFQTGVEVLGGQAKSLAKNAPKPQKEYKDMYASLFASSTGIKELQCMMMKVVDDDCASTHKPREFNEAEVETLEAEDVKADTSSLVNLVHETFSQSSLEKARASRKAQSKADLKAHLLKKAEAEKAMKKGDEDESVAAEFGIDREDYNNDGTTAMAEAMGDDLEDADPNFVCPISLPTGPGDANDNQEHYFNRLHELICDGVGFLNGTLDGSGNELLFNMYKEELKCLYAVVLKDNCGGLPSQFAGAREVGWDLYCLDHHRRITDVYGIMTKDEQLYYNKLVRTLEAQQVYKTFFSLSLGYKEVVCMVLKVIDDECAALASPRQMDPHRLFAAEHGHPPRGPEELQADSQKLMKLAEKVKAGKFL